MRVLAAVLGLTLIAGACTGSAPTKTTGTAGSPSTSAGLPSPHPLDSTAVAGDPIVEVVKRVTPAVVNVTTSVVNPEAILGGAQESQAVGTGFVIRADGIVVTNFHVVERALTIKVTFPPPDGRSFAARVVAGDSSHDLAVLKIQGTGLPTVPMGDSSKVLLGERVIALGYALALPGGPTVTSGIVSALGRTVRAQDPNGPNGQPVVRTYQDALQTDAAINPGNSGGPLVDLAGNVIAINTAGSEQAENVGFAIAVNAAKPIIQQAITHPRAAAAYLGVTSTTVDGGVAAQFGLSVDHGALIVEVTSGGPAAKASLEAGDVIVAFDGKPIEGSDQLGQSISAKKPGDTVSVQIVRRDGSKKAVSVTLGVRPGP